MTQNFSIRFDLYDFGASDMRTLKQYDYWAADSIKQAEEAIETAKKYRLSLAKRAAELASMGTHTKAVLRRENNHYSGIYYFLVRYKVYDDGTNTILDSKRYPGKERHKAIKEFRELKKQHPEYEFEEDIAKSKWER